MNDMPDPDKMIEAARLTRAGRLAEATALIRRMLRREISPGVGLADRPLLDAATSTQPRATHALRDLLDRVTRRSGLGLPGLKRPVPLPTPDIVPAGGKFLAATYGNAAGSRTYKLYIPSRY